MKKVKEQILHYGVDTVLGTIVAALTWGYRRVVRKARAREEEYRAIRDGQLALLHDRIYQECTSCITAESITVSQMRNLEYLYTAYHALGGNGTGTELYNRARALEIKED